MNPSPMSLACPDYYFQSLTGSEEKRSWGWEGRGGRGRVEERELPIAPPITNETEGAFLNFSLR